MSVRKILCAAALAVLLAANTVHAVLPDEMLKDPVLEARARAISQNLRCLVCQNQSIDDSEADLAHDLRTLVRERLKAGDSDEQVIRFIASRYGDYVLLKPPLKSETLLLWLGPIAMVFVAVFGIALFYSRKKPSVESEKLSPQELERLKSLLRQHPPGDERP